MADLGDAGPKTGQFLGEKIGPLPVIAWVGIVAGGIALLIAWRSRQGSTQPNTAASLAGGVGNPPVTQTDLDVATANIQQAVKDAQDKNQKAMDALAGGIIATDQDVRINRMMQSLMPGGQDAYNRLINSPASGAMRGADDFLRGIYAYEQDAVQQAAGVTPTLPNSAGAGSGSGGPTLNDVINNPGQKINVGGNTGLDNITEN